MHFWLVLKINSNEIGLHSHFRKWMEEILYRYGVQTVMDAFMHTYDGIYLLATGRYDECFHFMTRRIEELRTGPYAHFVPALQMQQVYAAAHAGQDPDTVYQLAVETLGNRAEAPRYFFPYSLGVVGGALAVAGHTPLALRMLNKAADQMDAQGMPLYQGTALVHLALVHDEQDDDAAAVVRTLDRIFGNPRIEMRNLTMIVSRRAVRRVCALCVRHDRHVAKARRIAARLLDADLLDDGSALPILHVNPITGTCRHRRSERILPGTGLSRFQRKLLLSVLGASGMAVEVETLKEKLWPEDEPASAKDKFDKLISRVRSALSGVFGKRAAKEYLKVQSGWVKLVHVVDALSTMAEVSAAGITHCKGNRPRQAYEHFVDMDAIAATEFEGLGREDFEMAERRDVGTVLDGAVLFAELSTLFGRPDQALDVCNRYLAFDPIHDGLQRRRFDTLNTLGQPAQAAKSLRLYRQKLIEDGFDEEEVEAILEGFW